MGRTRWKVVSDKKLSARKRGLGRFAVLSCVFFDDVLCSYRKSAKVYVMNRCFECPHFERFEHEMDEEDEKMMNEIDEIRKHGYSLEDV